MDTDIVKTSITSSYIAEVGYDPLMGNLIVTFNNGTEYTFMGAPRELYDEAVEVHNKGGSVGKFFSEKIKGKFEFLKKAPN